MQNSDRYTLPRWWWLAAWICVHLNALAIALEFFGYSIAPAQVRYTAISLLVFVAVSIQLLKGRET